MTEREDILGRKAISNNVLLVGLFVCMVTMFNQVNRRLDTLQAENQRQHDAMEEVLRVFEGRITRFEARAGVDSGTGE